MGTVGCEGAGGAGGGVAIGYVEEAPDSVEGGEVHFWRGGGGAMGVGIVLEVKEE